MARAYTAKLPAPRHIIRFAPVVTSKRKDRIGWYGVALDRFDNGDVMILWEDHEEFDADEHIDKLNSPMRWIPTERLKFEDVVWVEGLPDDEGE